MQTMTEIPVEETKKNRPYGYFQPDPKMIGYLFGYKGTALRDLAKNIQDGVYIRFNDQTGNFDIWARTNEGVTRTRQALLSRQNMEVGPPRIGTKNGGRQVVTVGNVTITIDGQAPVRVNLGQSGSVRKIHGSATNNVQSGRQIRKIARPGEYGAIGTTPVKPAKPTYATIASTAPVASESTDPVSSPELNKATSEIPRPVIVKASGKISWGERQEEDISSSGEDGEDDEDEDAKGNGEDAKGNGEDAKGNGEDAKGNGENAKGNGEDAKGNGN